MQEATQNSVLGNFANFRSRHQGVESTFFKRDSRFMVRTDGKLADYPIAYPFGVYPLQQYLIGRRPTSISATCTCVRAGSTRRWPPTSRPSHCNSAGRRAEALAVLRGANKRHPQDLDILGALVSDQPRSR